MSLSTSADAGFSGPKTMQTAHAEAPAKRFPEPSHKKVKIGKFGSVRALTPTTEALQEFDAPLTPN